MAEVARLKARSRRSRRRKKRLSKELDEALAQIPNLPLDEVPDGKRRERQCRAPSFRGEAQLRASRPSSISSSARRSVRWISRPPRSFRARALSCSRAVLARLERALGAIHARSCIRPSTATRRSAPPLLVRDEVMFGTAQLPKFDDDQFLATRDDCPRGTATRCAQICPAGSAGGLQGGTRSASH